MHLLNCIHMDSQDYERPHNRVLAQPASAASRAGVQANTTGIYLTSSVWYLVQFEHAKEPTGLPAEVGVLLMYSL